MEGSHERETVVKQTLYPEKYPFSETNNDINKNVNNKNTKDCCSNEDEGTVNKCQRVVDDKSTIDYVLKNKIWKYLICLIAMVVINILVI